MANIRASQITGCAHRLDMHTTDASATGETDQRPHRIAAWRERPICSERERAARAWTEALKLLQKTDASDDVDEQVADVSPLRNSWRSPPPTRGNRLAVGFRAEVRNYMSRWSTSISQRRGGHGLGLADSTPAPSNAHARVLYGLSFRPLRPEWASAAATIVTSGNTIHQMSWLQWRKPMIAVWMATQTTCCRSAVCLRS